MKGYELILQGILSIIMIYILETFTQTFIFNPYGWFIGLIIGGLIVMLIELIISSQSKNTEKGK